MSERASKACARRKIRLREGRRGQTFSFYSSPCSFSLSDATRVIPGTLGAKDPSSGDDSGRLSGKIGRDVGLAVGGKGGGGIGGGGGGNRYFDRSSTPDLPEPYFDATPPRNVSALVGKTAFLTCVVRNLGKAKSVSARTKQRDRFSTLVRSSRRVPVLSHVRCMEG